MYAKVVSGWVVNGWLKRVWFQREGYERGVRSRVERRVGFKEREKRGEK